MTNPTSRANDLWRAAFEPPFPAAHFRYEQIVLARTETPDR
jgi:hypothetical protein